MRIALFTETFIPKVDGIVTTLCQTVRQLTAQGHEILIFAPDGGFDCFECSSIVGMKGRSFAFYPELSLSLPRASMRAKIAEFQPDLIHVADPSLLGIAALYYGGGKQGGALHVPLVVSYHTDLPKYLHYYGLGFLERYIWPIMRVRHNRATINLCTSVAIVEQLREHGIQRVELWPESVDTDRFRPGCDSVAMRARLSQEHPESPLLLYVGRLSAEKGIERLKPIIKALPDARLALVGNGPHRKTLEHHFKGLPVFFAGFLHGEELASAYASSDVFVMPSRTETLGLVILEAMASSLPVVAARAGGIPELIQEGVSGYLFEEECEAVSAIRELLASPQKGLQMGAAARRQAEDHGWKSATSELLTHYRNACESQSISFNGNHLPPHPGLAYRTKSALARTALQAARKLLP